MRKLSEIFQDTAKKEGPTKILKIYSIGLAENH
jgi:hypothetical protein